MCNSTWSVAQMLQIKLILDPVCLLKYPGLSLKRATKSWRHPLRKPTARAVPTAVKQQAASDDGRLKPAHADSSRL